MTHRRRLLALLACIPAVVVTLAQAARLREGDLVAFERPQRRMMGIVISGPDPSSYYLLSIPGQADFAIHGEQLSLVQPTGTPDVALDLGASVGWTQAGAPRKGRLVKVHGAWCQVEPANEAAVVWVECALLRVAE